MLKKIVYRSFRVILKSLKSIHSVREDSTHKRVEILSMSSLKIVVAGPKGTGKSQLSNFLSGSTEEVSTERYDPTAGVRILEFDARIRENVTIELWDASGDHAFDGCWRAIMADADGVILIYNPDAPSQDQQIGDWFEFFVRKNGLKDDQCMVFAHRVNPTSERFRPPPLFSKVKASVTTPQSGPDIRNMFEDFVKEISSIKTRK